MGKCIKMLYKHTYTHIAIKYGKLLRHKKETLPFATTWMDPKGIMLSQKER